MTLSRWKILKYAVLPEIVPRIRNLFTSGFVYIAYLIAMIFHTARLLPSGHPYLYPKNMGYYGIRHVLAEGLNNIEFKWRNLDQIVIFTTILAGVVILGLQFILIAMAFVIQPVYAGVTFWDWFVIPSTHYNFDESYDIALGILDMIFGVEGIFNSCVSTGTACLNHHGEEIPSGLGAYPFPIHLALHQLFRYFSIGISIISLMIIIYLITTIVGETAASGTPFGRRFNRAWAPVRLILFFALLAPLNIGSTNEGLNGAQLITLWTAKFGSNFASNAWGEFNTVTNRRWLEGEELVAIPSKPDLGNLSQFWSVVHACMYGEAKRENDDIRIYVVRPTAGTTYDFSTPTPTPTGSSNALDITDFSAASTFAGILAFTESSSTITIRIGKRDPELYPAQLGNVLPVCGEMTQPVTTFLNDPLNWESAQPSNPGAYQLQLMMWYINLSLMDGTNAQGGADVAPVGKCFVDRIFPHARLACQLDPAGRTHEEIAADHAENLRDSIDTLTEHAIDEMISAASDPNGYMQMGDELLQRGWAGAAIWYNRLAQMNGEFTSAMFQVPKISKWPMVMEEVQRRQLQHSNAVHGAERFSLTLPDGHEYLASAYQRTYKFWEDFGAAQNMQDREPTQNPILDTIAGIFGASGLFNLRHPAVGDSPGNPEVHPLALLSSLGKSMVEAAIVNFGVAAGGTLGDGLLSLLGDFTASRVLLNTAAGFAATIAKFIILIGAMLFYVLPFLPFIYFFFALSGWIKSIFEAMVAMPLWALAHLRIDGEGVGGPGATNGYYLLLEIFVRPILILIGLIGSIMIMAALVEALNMIFDLVAVNVGGYDNENTTPDSMEFYRGYFDEFMYTCMYAVIVYMIATGCFKLIDSVPNNILRWMGASVSTIQEQAGDPASRISSGIYQKGQLTIEQVSGGLEGRGGRAEALMSMNR